MVENSSTQLQEECVTTQAEPRIKVRYFVLLIAFFAEILQHYHRLTLSISLIAMVNSSVSSNEMALSESCPNFTDTVDEMNYTNEKVENVHGEYQWTYELQGYIIGSASLGFVIAQPIAPKLTEIFGGRKLLLYFTFLSSLCTFISPFATYWSAYALLSVQLLRGLTMGFLNPGPVMLIVNWFPKQERGLALTIFLSGNPTGAMLGAYLTGVICEATFLGGWPSAFFISGSVGFIVCAVAFFFLYDNPRVHPNLSPAERQYILSNQENVLTEKRPKTPWKAVLTSVPVWALFYAYFGTNWAVVYFLTMNPIFLKAILHYSIKEDGLFSSLPFLLKILTANLSGILSTIFIKKGYITVNKSRKLWFFISTSGYSLCVLGIYFAGCDRYLAVFFSICALAFNGFSYAGCLVASADMSPIFAASIDAIACLFSSSTGFILPVVVGYFINDAQTLEQWNKVFFMNIAIVLSSGLIFGIFGSAKIQPWNDISEEKSQEMNEKEKT